MYNFLSVLYFVQWVNHNYSKSLPSLLFFPTPKKKAPLQPYLGYHLANTHPRLQLWVKKKQKMKKFLAVMHWQYLKYENTELSPESFYQLPFHIIFKTRSVLEQNT